METWPEPSVDFHEVITAAEDLHTGVVCTRSGSETFVLRISVDLLDAIEQYRQKVSAEHAVDLKITHVGRHLVASASFQLSADLCW